MKKRRNGRGIRSRLTVLSVAVLLMALCLTACGSKNMATDTAANSIAWEGDYNYMTEQSAATDYAGYPEEAYYDGEVTDAGTFSSQENVDYENSSVSNRKLIRNVNMSLETMEFDTLLASIRNKIAEVSGYIEDSSVYNGSAYEESYYNRRNASITARIPQDSLDTFLTDVTAIANVTDSSESTEDVTLQYVDMESRKEVLLAEQERLMNFLEQATNMEDVIALESRLSEVRYQIESMESQLRTYDNKVNYSTVHMYIQEVKKLTPVEEEGMFTRMKNGFMDSIENVSEGLRNFVIGFVIAIPYLIIWAIIIIVVVLIIKGIIKSVKKRKKKKTETVWVSPDKAEVKEEQNEPKL